MKLFVRYPHIDHFQQLVRTVCYDYSDLSYPTLDFLGTVKIHGANCAVGERHGVRWCQSRNHIVTPEHDVHAFAKFAEDRKDSFDQIFKAIYEACGCWPNYRYVLYGEWFGQGIQRGAAVCQLPRKFCVFDLRIIADDPDNQTKIVLSNLTL